MENHESEEFPQVETGPGRKIQDTVHVVHQVKSPDHRDSMGEDVPAVDDEIEDKNTQQELQRPGKIQDSKKSEVMVVCVLRHKCNGCGEDQAVDESIQKGNHEVPKNMTPTLLIHGLEGSIGFQKEKESTAEEEDDESDVFFQKFRHASGKGD